MQHLGDHLRPAVDEVEPAIFDAHAAINARTGERQAERASHRRFRIAGIGRAMARGIAQDGAEGFRGRGARREIGGSDEEQSREPRGGQIDEIVELAKSHGAAGVYTVKVTAEGASSTLEKTMGAEGLRAMVEGYMRVNTICLPAGHYRVEEGSEHSIEVVMG
mgnify:CR=1 FL=1